MRLKDKVAIITGSGSGIGRATAILFAQEGAKVVVSDINTTGGEETFKLIKDRGGEAIFVKADVSKGREVEGMVKRAVETYGKIDILVNNAGVVLVSSLVDTSEEEWDRVINTNLKGIFLCSKYVIPEMIKLGKGVIINISSTVALVGFSYLCAYGASKGGVIGLTKNMAEEFCSQNIRVDCICPGSTETPLLEQAFGGEEMGPIRHYMEAITPLGRFGQPEDIAAGALFLASDDASFITGHTLVINGGVSNRCMETNPERLLKISKDFVANQ